MSLVNNYLKPHIEHYAGRIPECLQWLDLGENSANELKALMLDGYTFDPKILEQYGWMGICAATGGQLEDEDENILAAVLADQGVDTLYATSLYSLERLKHGKFLGVVIPVPTGRDLNCLNGGWWCAGDWINRLKSQDLLWNSWQEQMLFSWPLTFALVQLCEGCGKTTIVGPQTFIKGFLQQSKPNDYEWEAWPKSTDD